MKYPVLLCFLQTAFIRQTVRNSSSLKWFGILVVSCFFEKDTFINNICLLQNRFGQIILWAEKVNTSVVLLFCFKTMCLQCHFFPHRNNIWTYVISCVHLAGWLLCVGPSSCLAWPSLVSVSAQGGIIVLGKAISSLPQLSAVFPKLPLKQCQCLSGWTQIVLDLWVWNISCFWPVHVAVLATLSAYSLPLTQACPGQ